MSRPKGTIAVRLDVNLARILASEIESIIGLDFRSSLLSDMGKNEKQLEGERSARDQRIGALLALSAALRPKRTGRRRLGSSVFYVPRDGVGELLTHYLPSETASLRSVSVRLRQALRKLEWASQRKKGRTYIRGERLDKHIAKLDNRIAYGDGDERWLRRLRARRRARSISAVQLRRLDANPNAMWSFVMTQPK